jgi:hypothetical protein
MSLDLKYVAFVAATLTLTLGGVAVATTVFEDDFEAYPVSNPADFGATNNWVWNGVDNGQGTNASRIFATGNFGGSQLWIAHPEANGSGIVSRGIPVTSDTAYSFSANLVAETFAGARDNEFSVDLLVGETPEAATSLIGGPLTVIGRGDGDDGVPPDAIPDSYEDQITTIPFTTGTLGIADDLFISVVYVGPGPSDDPGWAGVDNVAISQIPEPSTWVLLSLAAAIGLFWRRRS